MIGAFELLDAVLVAAMLVYEAAEALDAAGGVQRATREVDAKHVNPGEPPPNDANGASRILIVVDVVVASTAHQAKGIGDACLCRDGKARVLASDTVGADAAEARGRIGAEQRRRVTVPLRPRSAMARAHIDKKGQI